MIITIGAIKGGVGKTTIATNLAVMRSASGKKVLLVDADEQRSTSMWVGHRHASGVESKWCTICLSGLAILKELPKMKKDYDDIIIDVGGRETSSLRAAIAISNIFLIPFKPRSLDIWTIGSLKIVLSEMMPTNPKLMAVAIINQADAKGIDNEGALEILKEFKEIHCLDITIGSRKAFANAATEGLGVTEMKNADNKAVQEIRALYEFLYREAVCVHDVIRNESGAKVVLTKYEYSTKYVQI